jgi:hypothetical protein
MGEAVNPEEAHAFMRLIERMAPDIERELRATRSTPHMSLRGLWRGLDITGEGTDRPRQEMWSKFPPEDL